MESSSTGSRYVPQNSSKKRVFPGGTSSSSSSSGYKDVEVLEIPPPIGHWKSPSKQKQVISHEAIIDVDMEEEDDDDVMTIDDIGPSAKGKDFISSFPVGHSSTKYGPSGLNVQMPVNGAVEDFSSTAFHGEDETDWLEMYYDDIVYDEYHTVESHFDHMDIPPGVEAPFPWLPSSLNIDSTIPATNTSTNSSSQIPSAGVGHSPGLESYTYYPSGLPVTGQVNDMSSSFNKPADVHSVKAKRASKLADHFQKYSTTSSGQSFVSSQHSGGPSGHKSVAESLHGKSKRRSRASHSFSKLHLPPPNFPNAFSSGNSFATNPYLLKHAPFSSFFPMGENMPYYMAGPSNVSPGFMGESAVFSHVEGPADNQNSSSSLASAPARVDPKNVDEILQKFNVFKKFDTVEDCSDHHYSKNGSSAKQPPKNWAKRIQEEWKILESDLPDEIFVRVYESRMDLLRAVIVGAEGTPYHDGLYFFDVYFPSSYPSVPPHVHYHSGGLRINPNLYNCGKVCLSLLNTWSGSQKEKWLPGTSTMLQVLVSIQGLILNAKPYFNEPGYAHSAGSAHGEKSALDYNERTFMYSLQTMLYSIRRPPKHFEDFVVGHFCKHGRDILVCCKAYMDGAQVGCLAKGGVQDVDEGDKSCSQQFKNNLAGFITPMVDAFVLMGANDCEEFRSLAQKATGPPVPSVRHPSQYYNNY